VEELLEDQLGAAPSSSGVNFGQEPTTVLGDKTWANYTVASTAQLPGRASEFVAVFARFGNAFSFQSSGGYALRLWGGGAWNLTVRHANASESSLASGRTAPRGHLVELALTVHGTAVSAAVDGTRLSEATNGEWTRGLAGLGCGYHAARFATFSVRRPRESANR
jgi:hypothetical protein